MNTTPGSDIFRARINFTDIENVEWQCIRARIQGLNRLLILDSSSMFDSFKLLFGDEIQVRPCGGAEFDFIELVQPSAMRHYSFFTNSQPDDEFTDVLHKVGGEWECDMGGLLMIHVPRDRRNEFTAHTALILDRASEIFSGLLD